MAQYALDLAAAQAMSDAAAQVILNTLNPSFGALSTSQLAAFEQQLASIGSVGTVTLQNATIDENSQSAATIYDLAYTASANIAVQAGDGFDTITGSAGDTIYGSTSANGGANITGGAGNEVIYGGAGADTLNAGSGNDTLVGGTGAETLVGSSSSNGTALLEAGSGNQLLQAGVGSDTLIGGAGSDTLLGGYGSSTLYSGSIDGGHQLLEGGTGASILYAGSGSDTLCGGTGNSTLYAGYGHDSLYGGTSPLSTTTFVVTSNTFNNDVIKGGVTGSTNILDLADLNQSDVSLNTNSNTGVTSISYSGQTLSVSKVSEVDFANGTHLKL